MRRSLVHLPRRLFLLVMMAGALLIAASSLIYFDSEAVPPFVMEKLPVRFEALWLLSLRVHVAAALPSFPLCLLLMTRALQRRLSLHRWIGRVTAAVVLLALVPSGFVLAFDAKGGPIVTVGFLASGALIAWFMVRGIVDARRRELRGHRRAMRHVVAQMSVAATSRALLIGLAALGVGADLAYVVALWGPVVASAAIAELLSRPRAQAPGLITHFIERIRRERTSPPSPVRPRPVVLPAAGSGR